MSDSPYSQSTLKSSILHFFSGKLVSALLTFVTLLWLVRQLPVPEYAAYVTLVASLEVTLALAAFGLPWLVARYLPDFRLHAPRERFLLLLKRLLIWHSTILLLATLLLVAVVDLGLDSMGLQTYSRAAKIYLAMIIVDGIGRTARDSLLSTLLQQGLAQISLVARNVSFLAFLAFIKLNGDVHVEDVVIAELLAASLGAALALLGLIRHVRSIAVASGDPAWREPPVSEMLGVARQMYLSQLVNLTYSPQVFLLILSSRLTAEAIATFGFLHSLYVQVARYLPATLLFNLIQPKLVADFARAGGAGHLSRNINLAGKLSLFALFPAIVVVALAGDALVALLAGGKFPQAGMYFLGLLIGLIPFSQRQLLETAAVTTGYGKLCVYASLSGFLMLPLMLLLLAAGTGLWAPIVALGFGHLLFNIVIGFGLSRRIRYMADHAGLIRMLAIALLTYFGTNVVVAAGHPASFLLVTIFLVASLYLATAWMIKPFSRSERESINRLLGKRLFVW